MRSFASDNNSGVHPRVLEAISSANKDHAVGYGDDRWSEEAVSEIKKVFGDGCDVYFVFNGTGANCVAIRSCTPSYGAVICAETAHIFVDECGAPAAMSGATVIPVSTPDGKLTPELIAPKLHGFGECHHPQPSSVYISNVSELGTIYTIEEVKAIADLIHSHGMYLHMDGARLANACITLGCTMKELTVDAGVDILSFGGTKNGMMLGEAVISFREELSRNLKFIRKQSAQLASKQRYLAAQYIPYLRENIWYENARHANKMALRLAEILKKVEGVRFTQKIESNQLFFTAPAEIIKLLSDHYFFYFWNEAIGEIRLVTSWDTTEEDILNVEKILAC
ncbi:MAG: low specificity L-threonine aldolase [Bacteroidales bacterium]|nr:low specificity L-threonine aldolase [Bacteroidales bacterium]